MSGALASTLPDLSIMFILGGIGLIAIFYGATGDRKSRRTTFIAAGIVMLLIAAYLVTAYLFTGPGKALIERRPPGND